MQELQIPMRPIEVDVQVTTGAHISGSMYVPDSTYQTNDAQEVMHLLNDERSFIPLAVTGKKRGPFILSKTRYPFHRLQRVEIRYREGIVRTHEDAIRTDNVGDIAERFGPVGDRVEVYPLQVLARGAFDDPLTGRERPEAVIEAPLDPERHSPGMRKTEPKGRIAIQHPVHGELAILA